MTATVAPDLDLDETLREITRLRHELGLVADTVPSVARRTKPVAPDDLRRILAARLKIEADTKELRAAVLAARANGASQRETAKAADIAPSTVQEWEKAAKAEGEQA